MNKIEEQVIARSRISLLMLGVILLVAILGLRLFQKQVIQHDFYIAQAKSQHIARQEIPAERGKIFVTDFYDQSLYPLATNNTLYAVSLVPNQIRNKVEMASRLGPMIGKASGELLDALNKSKYYLPPVARGLSKEEADKIIQLKEDYDLDGLYLIPEYLRDHPEKEMAAHVLGFVDSDNEGRYGVEGFYNQQLKGEAGRLLVEKDVMGRQIAVASRNFVPPRNGKSILLTIDRVLQSVAEQKIQEAVKRHAADGGSIIIMDPKDGSILAMASYPTFNPNEYQKVENYDTFNNPATAKSYEPGSVFKIFTMAAALDTGKITPETTETFGASVQIGEHTIYTSDKKAHGTITMTQALELSDNVALVWVERLLGSSIFHKYIKLFGFGTSTGIDVDGETFGLVKGVEEALEIDNATMSFGQGIAVTPIQLITAVSAIANGGKLIQPHLIRAFVDEAGNFDEVKPKIVRQVIAPSTAAALTQMMVSVVERGHGQQAGVKGYRVAGKTGTAQIPLPTGGYDKNNTIGSFAGFAPADDPKFAMLVKIDKPKDVIWAESTAAPVFGELASFMLDYFQIPPR